jgi:hypothetical protein
MAWWGGSVVYTLMYSADMSISQYIPVYTGMCFYPSNRLVYSSIDFDQLSTAPLAKLAQGESGVPANLVRTAWVQFLPPQHKACFVLSTKQYACL